MCRGEWIHRGVPLYSIDWFFAWRSARFEPTHDGLTELEREVHNTWHWWSCHEIEATTEIVRPTGLAGRLFTFELGLLIDVPRPQRRILVGGRMFDVTVDADRTAMDDSPDPAGRGREDDGPHRGGVHRAVLLVAQSGLPVDGRDVIDDVDAGARTFERAAIFQIPFDDLDAGSRKLAAGSGPAAAANQPPHLIPAPRELTRKMAAGEPAGTGD